MDFKQSSVLITGGSEGIGKGLAARFLAAGSTVLVTGRNADRLKKAELDLPGLKTLVNDISIPAQREALAVYVREVLPGINIVINNAGIQRRIALAQDQAPWQERQAEIDILLSGPIHLNHLLIPLLLSDERSGVIVNVTSGGAYLPQVFAPVYSACKAALHSYTMTLRHALAGTRCKVVELIPPAVQTSLAGTGSNHGVSLDEFCDVVFGKLAEGRQDVVGFGITEKFKLALMGESQDDLFQTRSAQFSITTYAKK